jgi:hypothetical protein
MRNDVVSYKDPIYELAQTKGLNLPVVEAKIIITRRQLIVFF